jgi:hypothetical protein
MTSQRVILGAWQKGGLHAELLCVLRVQPLPAELHRLTTNNAADGSSVQKAIQNIETNVPPGSTHGDEAAIDVVPQLRRVRHQGIRVPTGAYTALPSCTQAPWARQLASRLFRKPATWALPPW